jgi:hypothetical protein
VVTRWPPLGPKKRTWLNSINCFKSIWVAAAIRFGITDVQVAMKRSPPL